MKDRLIRLLDSEQLTASKFADIIGVQPSSVSHVLSGRNKPSFDFIEKTLKAFPGVNPEWLILGRGEMMSGLYGYEPGTLFGEQEKRPPAKDLNEGKYDIPVKAEDVGDRKADRVSELITDDSRGSKVRKVIKVIMFYDDNTFTAFQPSD
ncbi:MAG: helix-turn-helix transcriptional regulator [Bacteroidales bacterium]|nr:helix-turn-helix transcriptional regulator [Bacteroidales bacterium]